MRITADGSTRTLTEWLAMEAGLTPYEVGDLWVTGWELMDPYRGEPLQGEDRRVLRLLLSRIDRRACR